MLEKVIIAAGLIALGVIWVGSIQSARIASMQIGPGGVRLTADRPPVPIELVRMPKLAMSR
jgi:hypothetical protein